MTEGPTVQVTASNESAVHRWMRRAEYALSVPACGLLLAMMMLTVIDVVGRYLFSSPLRWAFELTEISLAMLIFCGMPAISLHGTHIVTDLVDSLLSLKGRAALMRIVDAVCGLALVGVAFLLWRRAGSMVESNDKTPVARIELGPIVYVIAVFLALTAVVHLARAIWGSMPSQAETAETSLG